MDTIVPLKIGSMVRDVVGWLWVVVDIEPLHELPYVLFREETYGEAQYGRVSFSDMGNFDHVKMDELDGKQTVTEHEARERGEI